MANKGRIKSMAKELNLMTLASEPIKELGIGNLDFLERVLFRELEVRKQNAISRARRHSNLPQTKFDIGKLNSGLKYQVEKLARCGWVDTNRNLVIIGEPNTGKTALATHLAATAIENGFKAYYIKLDDLLIILKHKEVMHKAQATFSRIKNADILVLDEMLYLDIPKADLELLYKILMQLNETTSIAFVTNREISDWLRASEDEYTMQLLVKRAVENSETIRHL